MNIIFIRASNFVKIKIRIRRPPFLILFNRKLRENVKIVDIEKFIRIFSSSVKALYYLYV